MNDFLRKINLIQETTIELPVSKMTFRDKFKENVDYSDLSFQLFEGFEALSSNNKIYKGFINDREFQIKKRRKLFDTNYSFAKATGRLTENTEKLIIKTEINAFQRKMVFFFGFIVLFYAMFIVSFFFIGNSAPIFILPFILLHASLMFGIPYFVMRRSVKRMIYDLERDFHYWVTKN